MVERHYKPEEIVARLRQVDVLISQGQNIVDAIRQSDVSEVTYCSFEVDHQLEFGWELRR